MSTYVMRLWLPDRPGALGAVASRIGAVRGDLVGIDILERGAGRVIDELVVDLPDDDLLDLLVREVDQVDGVDVEDVRPAPDLLHDPRLDALHAAQRLVAASCPEDLIDELVERAGRDFEADWVVLLDPDGPAVTAAAGGHPPVAWLAAFAGGAAHMKTDGGPEDVSWAALPVAGLSLLLGRQGRPFRARERHQVAALADIADARWAELAWREARLSHPSSA
jgi:hypothetical protein